MECLASSDADKDILKAALPFCIPTAVWALWLHTVVALGIVIDFISSAFVTLYHFMHLYIELLMGVDVCAPRPIVSTDTAGGSLAITECEYPLDYLASLTLSDWGHGAVCVCYMVSVLLQWELCPAGGNESLGSHWHHPYRGAWDISSKLYEGGSLDFTFGLC